MPEGRQEANALGDIGVQIEGGITDRLADGDTAGEMDHRVDGMLCQDRLDQGGVADLGFHEDRRLMDSLPVPARQIVDDHDMVAALDEQIDHRRSDVSGSAGHQNPIHDWTSR